jgi:hypothetical protein
MRSEPAATVYSLSKKRALRADDDAELRRRAQIEPVEPALAAPGGGVAA